MASNAKDVLSSAILNVEKKLKNADNYPVWKFQLGILFKSEGLTDIIEGKSKLDDIEGANAKADWIKKDGLAQKFIMVTVDKTKMIHFLKCTTSHEMMNVVNKLYGKETVPQKCELFSMFHNYKFDSMHDALANVACQWLTS